MAHLPRWISVGHVDSAALLSAFLQYRESAQGDEAADLALLYAEEHALPPWSQYVAKVSPVPTRPCSQANCARCLHRKGGYRFRWMDRRWVHLYEQRVKSRHEGGERDELTDSAEPSTKQVRPCTEQDPPHASRHGRTTDDIIDEVLSSDTNPELMAHALMARTLLEPLKLNNPANEGIIMSAITQAKGAEPQTRKEAIKKAVSLALMRIIMGSSCYDAVRALKTMKSSSRRGSSQDTAHSDIIGQLVWVRTARSLLQPLGLSNSKNDELMAAVLRRAHSNDGSIDEEAIGAALAHMIQDSQCDDGACPP